MGFRHKLFSFGKRCLGAFGCTAFVIPTMRYGQVPWQNMHITHTIDLKGATSVQIVEEAGDAKQRFATLQVTGRAVNPQNMPLGRPQYRQILFSLDFISRSFALSFCAHVL